MNQKLIEKLHNYGYVRTCKEVNDTVIIIMTQGFDDDYLKVCTTMQHIQDFYYEHTVVETLIAEQNFFHLVLIKPKK